MGSMPSMDPCLLDGCHGPPSIRYGGTSIPTLGCACALVLTTKHLSKAQAQAPSTKQAPEKKVLHPAVFPNFASSASSTSTPRPNIHLNLSCPLVLVLSSPPSLFLDTTTCVIHSLPPYLPCLALLLLPHLAKSVPVCSPLAVAHPFDIHSSLACFWTACLLAASRCLVPCLQSPRLRLRSLPLPCRRRSCNCWVTALFAPSSHPLLPSSLVFASPPLVTTTSPTPTTLDP